VSGNYQSWNLDAPGGLNDTMAAVSSGLATAQTAVSVTQLETERFLTEYGGDVVGGHAPVNAPGRQGDPDLERDASDG
jgi:hypothetical protein